jgi:5'-nucleotidase
MRILITNDDGVRAPGLAVLTRAVAQWMAKAPSGEIREALVVAPDVNYSGMSSAVGDVFDNPKIKYRRHVIEGAESIDAYALEAPPALCAILGSLGSFHFQPDVIVSGINNGANVGRSVLHSGTIGAILTGAQLGLSGLAISVQWGEDVHYDTAAAVAIEVLQELMNAPSRTLLNLNVPNLPGNELKGVRRGRISTAGVVKAAGPNRPEANRWARRRRTAPCVSAPRHPNSATSATKRPTKTERCSCRRLRLAHAASRPPGGHRHRSARHDAGRPRGD